MRSALPWIAKALAAHQRRARAQEGLRDHRGHRLAQGRHHGAPGPGRRRRGDPVSRDPGPREVPQRDADRAAAQALPKRLAPHPGRRDRGPRDRCWPTATSGTTRCCLCSPTPTPRCARSPRASSGPRSRTTSRSRSCGPSARPTGRPRTGPWTRSRELGPEFIRAFLDRAHSDDPVEKALAVSIAVTDPRARRPCPHCIQFLSDEDWWLRDRAALALAEIKQDDRAAAPPEDAHEPRVQPVGRRPRWASGDRRRRCPGCSRSTSRPRGRRSCGWRSWTRSERSTTRAFRRCSPTSPRSTRTRWSRRRRRGPPRSAPAPRPRRDDGRRTRLRAARLRGELEAHAQ